MEQGSWGQPGTGNKGRNLDLLISHLLRAGVMVATLLTVAGACLYLLHHGGQPVTYDIFRGEPPDLKGLSAVWHDALSLSGRGLIQLGLLVLIATPVVRVLASAMAFMAAGDRLYLLITMAVLVLLLASLFGWLG